MAKHYMIYYKSGTGTYLVTEPRPWARENQHFFPQFDFINTHPTTNEIEQWLIQNRNFQLPLINDNNVVVIQNLDPNLNL
jgi:hypothetical protein